MHVCATCATIHHNGAEDYGIDPQRDKEIDAYEAGIDRLDLDARRFLSIDTENAPVFLDPMLGCLICGTRLAGDYYPAEIFTLD